MSLLLIVRHGETDFNIQSRYCGSTDIPLNAQGISQAEELAFSLLERGLSRIIASPLVRTRQTANIINSQLQLPLVIMDEFRERNVGVYEGLTQNEAAERYPELWVRNITRVWNEAPPGGETPEEVYSRVTSGIQKLKSAPFQNGNVLLVTHGFISKIINAILHDVPPERIYEYKLDTACVAQYPL